MSALGNTCHTDLSWVDHFLHGTCGIACGDNSSPISHRFDFGKALKMSMGQSAGPVALSQSAFSSNAIDATVTPEAYRCRTH